MMRVLHIIKTTSLDTDGRLLKWLKFLENSNIESDVFIVQDSNENGCFLAYNAQIISIPLTSRRVFKKQKGYFIKVPEYSFRFVNFFLRNRNKYKCVVFHDMQQYLNISAIRILFRNWKGNVVWDMHELPHPIFFKQVFFRKILSRILGSVDFLIYTNKDRRKVTLEKFCYEESRYSILNNYPDTAFNSSSVQRISKNIDDWLQGEKYILWLGAASNARNFKNFIEIYNSEYKAKYKLIILGKVEDEFAILCNKLIIENRVKNAFVKQSELINYIDNSYFSVVLYRDNTLNNLYCEPNRLYQLLNRGIPVIVGNNPTLLNVVEGRDFGIVLSDDGSKPEPLRDAFETMIKKREFYSQALKLNNTKHQLNIDEQFKEIVNTFKKL